jgi:hypothetical protein
MTEYLWECPECEDSTGGCYPETFCRFCGQGNIIRNMTASEAETDFEQMLEDQIDALHLDTMASNTAQLSPKQN